MPWKAKDKARDHLELLSSMTVGALMGIGVDSEETYVRNLVRIINGMITDESLEIGTKLPSHRIIRITIDQKNWKKKQIGYQRKI